MTIRLAEPEARALEGFCRRQLAWDQGLAARVVTAPAAVGVFTTPPLGVLVFMAVPTVHPIATGDARDVVVPLSAVAAQLRTAETDGLDLDAMPRALVAPAATPSLQHLPPSDGWQVPITAIAGDLVPMVTEATAEFESRSAGQPAREQEQVAEEIWQRTAFAGLPLRALLAAQRLGMIGNDSSRVAAATSGPWKRLSTTRGQIFVHATGPAARLQLHVVR